RSAVCVALSPAAAPAVPPPARRPAPPPTYTPPPPQPPPADFTEAPALGEAEFIAAVATGYDAVRPETDLLCLGEMGIGNTTAAAAIAAALFGGGSLRWAGRGTGVDDARLAHKRVVINQALAFHASVLNDPLRVAASLGGRELAAILGATLAARKLRIPVVLDGFV